jgi:AraC-like DNA-binding protein/ligand-binding sensor protein
MNSPAPTPAPLAPTTVRDVVSRLRQSEIFRHYQQAFQIATGLPLALRAVDSLQTAWHGNRAINPLCALLATRNQSCAACLQLQGRFEAGGADGPPVQTLECFAGLTESAVPVRVGERVIAFLQTGQILARPPTEARFARLRTQLAEWGATPDEAELRHAFFGTRVMRRPQYEAILDLLRNFAGHLSLLSNELVIADSTSESPMITRAKAYIHDHLGEDLTLGQVAEAVHVSPTYFCKLFKQAVGLHFTDYVARVRIEAVKQLLLNPHKRVSEAAYEAGFQSLSQFNRVFRRVAGEPPSTYREHLHASLATRGRRTTAAVAA